MPQTSRREFLGHLGRGLLLAGLGPGVVSARPLAHLAEGGDDALDFGELEPLVALMQETEPDRLLPTLVDQLQTGLTLERLVAAGALANARTFGGESYSGYHAFMALVPSLEMAMLSGEPGRPDPLPVLKVLYRNATFMQDAGGRAHEALHPVLPADPGSQQRLDGQAVRQALRAADMQAAEERFASVCRGRPDQAYDDLQAVVHDAVDVHRIVLAWRAWDMLHIVGTEHAHTMLRQSVRHCVDVERLRQRRGKPEPSLRQLLPQLLDEHGLVEGPPGTETPDDARVAELADTIFAASREDAAAAMAAALAEGLAVRDLGECLSLVGNRLLLDDRGRTSAAPGKPVGSVHGASVGVHASDASRAWRNVLAVVNPANQAAGLVVAAYHAGGQSDLVGNGPFPWAERGDEAAAHAPADLLAALRAAIADNDQALACALVDRYGGLELQQAPLVEVLLAASIEADGALHAEKYFSTVVQELAEARPAFRRRHLLGLARVAASQNGHEAPGLGPARELLSA